MPKHRVNLDALIVREDLQVTSANADRPGGDVGSINIVELEQGKSMFDVLRKPDFQRETSEWTSEQIVELVKNVLDEELVPAVIAWKAPNRNVFVIDGAHRLSALIAWVNNDYGAGNISLKFYGGIDAIPKAQREAAKATEELINTQIGSYQSLSKFRREEKGATPEQIRRARNAASTFVVVQSVRNDATHAEASFYRINQGGAVIDETEKEIILARRRPEALAARALLRAGTGHQYWSEFQPVVKDEIEKLAKSLYAMLYQPDLEEPPRTLELPMAGKGYSADALAVLFEFIHLANGLTRASVGGKKSKSVALAPLPTSDPLRDPDGSKTIDYLKAVKRITEMITSDYSGSLGLHPAVYSYSATGRFQPTSFFAQVEFIKDLERRKKFNEFIPIRAQFEDFLVTYKYFINQLISNYGSNTRALEPLSDLYKLIYDEILSGKTNDQVRGIVLNDQRFSSRLTLIEPGLSPLGQRFSKDTKAAIRIKAALDSATRCSICKARYHAYSNTIDHKTPVSAGGLGSMSNRGVTHPYCNSGFKNWLSSQPQQAMRPSTSQSSVSAMP